MLPMVVQRKDTSRGACVYALSTRTLWQFENEIRRWPRLKRVVLTVLVDCVSHCAREHLTSASSVRWGVSLEPCIETEINYRDQMSSADRLLFRPVIITERPTTPSPGAFRTCRDT